MQFFQFYQQCYDVQKQPWSRYCLCGHLSGCGFGRSWIKVFGGQTHQPHDICSRAMEAMRSRFQPSKTPPLAVEPTPTSPQPVTVIENSLTCAVETEHIRTHAPSYCCFLALVFIFRFNNTLFYITVSFG